MADGEANTAQEKALYNAFLRFDENGDGRIQAGEFHKLMHSLGSFTDDEITKLFQEADSDDSGSVDWKEFIRWICSGAATKDMDASIKDTFTHFLATEDLQEAAFIESSSVTKHVLATLQQANKDKAEAEHSKELKRKQKQMKKEKEEHNRMHAHDVGIEPDYTGFRLPLPVTYDSAMQLVQHYLLKGDQEPLHPKYVQYLTHEFTERYQHKHPKPVVELQMPKSGRLIIVGDTHGQLQDVLHIFHQMGPPSPTNRYLFNGDIADRGPRSVEIFMILFAFFIADNECIVINRGNHENEDMNVLDADSGGGFCDEVTSKYCLSAYRRFVNAFKVLSLCTVVQKEIFVVHGGLTRVRALQLDYINTIDHHACTTPPPQSTVVKDQIFSDLVWSDPTDHHGKFKSDRGIGLKFGPDLTTKFCMVNRLRFVIRSHQIPEDGRGYRKQHEGRCVTIFSASNYCGNAGNYGAVLVLNSAHYPKYEIFEHYAASLEELRQVMVTATAGKKADLTQSGKDTHKKQQASASQERWAKELQRMLIALIEKKPLVWAHIIDANMGKGLPLDEWSELMSELVESSKPWKKAAESWALADESGRIDVGNFLKRWSVQLDSEKFNAFLLKAVTVTFKNILSLDMDLEKTFKYFDQDGDGTVDVKELKQVFSMFDLGLTPAQLDRITGQIFDQVLRAREEEGTSSANQNMSTVRVDIGEFLRSLTIVYRQADESTENERLEPWLLDALTQIAQLILRTPAEEIVSEIEAAATKIQAIFRGKQTRDARKESADAAAAKKPKPASSIQTNDKIVAKMVTLFRALDSSGDGQLQIEEFADGLMRVPNITSIVVNGKPLDKDMMTKIAKGIDKSGNGTINYLEFLQAFQAETQKSKGIADALAEDIATVLFRHRTAVRMGCQYLDEDGHGKVAASDFQTVLHGVNSALSRTERTLTNQQISLLVESLTIDDPHEGPVVDYSNFLSSFVIVDTAQANKVVKRF
eukprot:TRINITY_DN46929_c0_g1_i1.p1 TRINITY_DN46929_c0_g1~~TRINITY_DN46929_c0_g1_i1.p1  ORF type:complete len:983 (+),score=176.73 TRINITY_DN46929_c0_g1_i1:117-3065(+)